MRAVIQRVTAARVTVDGRETGRIGRGLVILLGIEEADTVADGEWLAQKIAKLRLFDDAAGRMNHSLLDLCGRSELQLSTGNPEPAGEARALVISQFTLFASTQKGTRPSFHRAAKPEIARPLYEQFLAQISAVTGRPTAAGEFGAMMQVELTNDGPVTLVIDSKLRE